MKILKMPLKEILLKIYRKPKLIVLNYLITNSDLKGKKWFAKYFNKIKLLNTAEGGGI